MSFKCQIFQTRLTFNNNVFFVKNNCDVRLKNMIILCVISVIILPIIKCAKLENPQIRLLINDDDLLQEKTNIHEAASSASASVSRDNSGEHFNLYRSELKRLSYETIHRILRDENEPSYRREDTELRYYQKRSPSYEESHQLIKRSVSKDKEIILNLSHRNLTEISLTPFLVKRLSMVSSLDLSHNYLSNINISLLNNITSLVSLNLQNNSFTFIPLPQQTLLRSLNLNHNLIKTSSLSSNLYLRNLYLSGNLIESLASLQLSLLKNLESLDISHNLLETTETSFFTERMHNLKHLNLAYNQLGSIYRETFYNLLSLNTLLLSHNNISDIDYETFLALPNLQYLDLSFNGLKGKSIRALQGITGLVALNIAFNPEIGPFMQEFVASWSLKELDASGTGLCQIPAALAQSVRSLKLTHNWLKIINCGDLDSYPLLQYLDLSFSHIEHIEDDALGRLEILEILMLDHNKLRKVPFSLPVSLEHLFLQNNDIMEIPQQAFQGLNNLKTLDLSHNKLLYLPDIMLPKLQTLNLQSSDIRGISQGIIHTLPKLNDLMLEDNPIKCADLLGIAEWASTCRLRGEKGEEDGDGEEAQSEEEENFVLKIQNLKNKFERMHNFYEQFNLNVTNLNVSLLDNLPEPKCVKEFKLSGQLNRNIEKFPGEKGEEELDIKQNSDISSLKQTNEKELDLNENLIETEVVVKQQDTNATNPNSSETTLQTTITTKQSSSLNEKQLSYTTTPKSFNLLPHAATTTTNNTRETSVILEDLNVEGITEIYTNADVIATTTTRPQQTITAVYKGNPISTKTSSNMTDKVKHEDGLTKRSKESEHILEDMQHKTISAKTFQAAKSKKWLKLRTTTTLATPTTSPSSQKEETTQNRLTTAAAVFIESTTFATPINNQTHTTTIDKHKITTDMLELLKNTTEAKKFSTKLEDMEEVNKQQQKEEFNNKETSKLQIHLKQSKMKTNFTTTKELKSLTTEIPKSRQTKLTQTTQESVVGTTIAAIKSTTIANKKETEIMANKEMNISPNLKTNETTTTQSLQTNTLTNKSATAKAIEYQQQVNTTNNVVFHQTTKTTNATKTTPTTMALTTLNKEQNLTSNYNDNEHNNRTQITKTINKINNNILVIATTTPTTTSINTTEEESYNNGNQHLSKSTTTATTLQTTIAIKDKMDNQPLQHQQTNILEKLMPQEQQQNQHYQSLKKDVNVKCMQSNSNECNGTQEPKIVNAFDTKPTRQTVTEEPTVTTAKETTSTTKTPTAAVMLHKHEPLQLLVKDRHLIGTPLLMHKGENLMVTADELILPTNNHNAEQDEHKNGNKNQQNDLETSYLMAGDSKNTYNLDISQTTSMTTTITTTTTTLAAAAATETTTLAAVLDANKSTKLQHNINNSSNNKNLPEDIKPQDAVSKKQANVDVHGDDDDTWGKIRKPNYEAKTKKPSLIMKKMTIITKQHEHEDNNKQHLNQQLAETLENEVYTKHYQELKPLQTTNKDKLDSVGRSNKHSTVNTPLSSSSGPQDLHQPASLLKQPHTFQHEHELLIQQILQDQQAASETHVKLTKTEQWSDLRKAESKENHPGIILLVSSGLFLVLLLGLMHVYRCDMPWRRHSPSHHLRPHQRQNHSFEDDSHSFLSYSEGMQKWHHSARQEAPYNSPLHNLHVRELQKTSAIEKPATVKSTASNFKPPPLSHSLIQNNNRSLSQSSTTTTSTASASSSAILDDESFYIEMTPDSGQYTRALQSELLPMELLNMAQIQNLNDPELSMGDSQTSMEDDCVVHYQQNTNSQQRLHQSSHLSALTASSDLSTLASPSATTVSGVSASTSLSVKPHMAGRKFGLW